MNYQLRLKGREDLSAGNEWIFGDNPEAAEAFLVSAKATFERLAQFPEFGPLARFKSPKLAGVRFATLQPPYQKWVVVYRIQGQTVDIGRVIYGNMNWRKSPKWFL
jgi:plasmid stabilization system protein ParE